MSVETSDPRAEVGSIRPVADLLQGADVARLSDSTAEALAQAVLAGFVVRYHTRNGLRRAVLYGPWEVDPASIPAPQATG